MALLQIACGSSLALPSSAPQPTDAFEIVGFAPPPARVEIVPAPPSSGLVWVDGEWSWDATRWAWERGRWVAPPDGASFAKWAMVRRRDGTLLLASGSWRNAQGREVAPPPPALAVARAGSGTVWDADGQREDTGPNVGPEGDPRDPK